MAGLPLGKRVRRWSLAVSCVPLVMLAGCPQENTAAPGKPPVQATAPAITAGSKKGSAGQQSSQPAVPAAAQTADPVLTIPRPRARSRRSSDPHRRGALRLVPSAEALLHPRAAEALVLAFRPLSLAR